MAEPTEGKVAARVAALERAHGIEVVTASIAKADVYPELPWRAGALAASLTALVRRDRRRAAPRLGDVDDAARVARDRHDRRRRRLAADDLLAGARAAVPVAHARRGRGPAVRARVLPRAPAVPHAPAPRRAALDRAVRASRRGRRRRRLRGPDRRAEWGSIIPPMLPLLREGRADDALVAGLDALDALLSSRGFVGDGRAPNELPDATMHEDAGDR
jgi:hypothetical protein